MRTVTFSNDDVSAAINTACVATWNNRKEGFHNCDQKEETRIAKLDAFATRNFCTFFVTPKREVLHYFSGYFNPELFKRELTFVGALAKEVLGEDKCVKNWPRYYEMHREAMLGTVAGSIKKGTETEKANRNTEVKAYVTRVHEALSKKKTKIDEVFEKYLFGTSWSEER